ncbi:thiol peroxidase (atypical 2-Cys peroxiredoxin) [Leeuwenhoekiella aestuarii]|uniref:Thiol peroxidase n=1 Tax=Leeuwenhoekiella aestuarii TaxID=2249426 RepID=A0A4Q0NWI2_9FLAO|nr:thiol peroxidase [Leeuwenhoekiella aestuarii]RXG15742.1 thiol peroxidase (atypical 2-Cys peroxiredoxin) [Leeuwenhoekiella aestuarii]RXG17149.1 thiol peroxidase (atypical 2-Cys peroxiredoxin) [Leeuwenhoekiella aestuarii]
MATITLGGNPTHTNGVLPKVGTPAPDFKLAATDLTQVSLEDYKGKRVVMNIFPSVDTGVCAASVRHFNKEASALKDTAVLCISRDLPFAQARFCGAEGLDNVATLSDFKDGSFGKEYGLEIADGAFAGLHSRVVLVLDADHTLIYSEQVPEIGQEPNYEAALSSLN